MPFSIKIPPIFPSIDLMALRLAASFGREQRRSPVINL